MRISAKNELIAYLTETKGMLHDLLNIVEGRNKTEKMKALKAIITVFLARLEATLLGAKAGVGEDIYISSIVVQRSLYDDVVLFIAKQLS
jgi:hypothetical protein